MSKVSKNYNNDEYEKEKTITVIDKNKDVVIEGFNGIKNTNSLKLIIKYN